MNQRKMEIIERVKKFLLEEGWLESEYEFDLSYDFRKDLKFTNREMSEMLFMAETEFNVDFSGEEQGIQTIAGFVDAVSEKIQTI